ncbi:hypothetical protein HGRIS_011782 [Hohenbuehelia grisea]|uniref:Nuclear condensin complex subunit 3 C-terminal domain-containing protein n=1 Tax=Hohenbuehelia grisea TaxID=104357 RepID=A0ABR3JWC4_9AGAR
MPGAVKKEDSTPRPLDVLLSHIPRVFEQAQFTVNNHQKNIVALHKIHAEAAEHVEELTNGRGSKQVGERAFIDRLLEMVVKILVLKKGTTNVDRIVRFIGAYIKYANERAFELLGEDAEDDDEDRDSFASRCTARILKFLLPGFLAKDKTARYRVVQIIAEMVSHLGEIDADIYAELHSALRERVFDKEAAVRVQAVIALSKMVGSEDPDELEDGEPTAMDLLKDALCDPAAEVRRAAMLNLPVWEGLDSILTRGRDEDVTNRKLVLKILKDNAFLPPDDDQLGKQQMGPTYPRRLTIAQREEIVRNGLGDRDASVRSATGDLLAIWVECLSGLCDSAADGQEEAIKDEDAEDVKLEDGVAKPQPKKVLDYQAGLLALLNMFDLGLDTIAEDALMSIFATRSDIFDSLEFNDDFWHSPSPEKVFLARVFVEYCASKKDQARLDSALPVATAFAFRIQSAFNALQTAINDQKEAAGLVLEDEETRNRREDNMVDNIYVVGEMLKLAVHFDYADEIGRRKMFPLIREMLSKLELPETLVWPSLDLLRELTQGERDLIRLIVEITQDLRDPSYSDDDEEHPENPGSDEMDIGATPATVKPQRVTLFGNLKTREDMSPEEQARTDAVDRRCLALLIAVLERVNGRLEENTVLDGVLKEIILPSVSHKELEFREQGAIAMGLCSLIHRPMAGQCITVCMKEMKSLDNPASFRLHMVHIFFDILMVNERDFLGKNAETAKTLTDFALEMFKDEEDKQVQTAIGLGLTKLVLAGMLHDDTVLSNLVWVYFQPATSDNPELTQCLACFLSAYSSCSPLHQHSIKQLFLATIREFSDLRKKEDGHDMVSTAQAAAIFADWTNPLKLKLKTVRPQDEEVHIDMAISIIREALIDKDNLYDKDDKKALSQLLNKLYIPDEVEATKLRELKLLLHGCRSRRPLRDATSKNALAKFDTMISKKFEKQLEGFDEQEYRKYEELKSLFAFLDDIFPEDDDDEADLDAAKKRKKRRSDSIISASTEGEDASVASSSTRNSKGKVTAKRPRMSRSEDGSDDEDNDTPPPPRRARPQRAAAAKAKVQEVITISSDSDEDEEQATPVARKGRRPRSPNPEVKEEDDINDEVDQILTADTSTEIPFDSIMDDSEEEEDEVNGLILGGAGDD